MDFNKFKNVQHLKIHEENCDQRIDNFLYRLFNQQIPRSVVYSIIRTGQVRVNSGRIKPGHHLKINDDVRVPPVKMLPEQLINSNLNTTNNITKKPNKKFLDYWQEKLSKAIIFENQNLLVINKPAKLAVHGGSKVTIGVIDILRNLRPEDHFLELVHRIDQDTSGCLMIAKKRSYLKKLHSLLREQKITKTYSALVSGEFTHKKIVEVPLKKIIKSSKEHFVRPDPEGGYAKTEFIPERVFKNLNIENTEDNSYSLIIAKPTTGKTHQIRVHLAHIGFPIINDDKYGNREYNPNTNSLGLSRMFLHAKSLKFVCPQTDQIINITAEYDTDLSEVVSKLEHLSK